MIVEKRFTNTSSRPILKRQVSRKLSGITESQRREIDHTLACDEQLRRDQLLLHDRTKSGEAQMKSLNGMKESKRFQGSTFDEFWRRRLTEDRDTILEILKQNSGTTE